jgi:hypothetical protein
VIWGYLLIRLFAMIDDVLEVRIVLEGGRWRNWSSNGRLAKLIVLWGNLGIMEGCFRGVARYRPKGKGRVPTFHLDIDIDVLYITSLHETPLRERRFIEFI